MFGACGIWCLADVSSVSPSSEQTDLIKPIFSVLAHAEKQFFFKTSLRQFKLILTNIEQQSTKETMIYIYLKYIFSHCPNQTQAYSLPIRMIFTLANNVELICAIVMHIPFPFAYIFPCFLCVRVLYI